MYTRSFVPNPREKRDRLKWDGGGKLNVYKLQYIKFINTHTEYGMYCTFSGAMRKFFLEGILTRPLKFNVHACNASFHDGLSVSKVMMSLPSWKGANADIDRINSHEEQNPNKQVRWGERRKQNFWTPLDTCLTKKKKGHRCSKRQNKHTVSITSFTHSKTYLLPYK